jgi:hypothetical protein
MSWNSIRKCLVVAATLCIFSAPSSGIEDTSPDVKVELSSQKPLSLHVTVRCRAATRVTLYKNLLPWGNVNNMMIIAVTPAERFVKSAYPIDDPSMESVSMDRNEKQSGDVILQLRFMGLDVRDWRSHHANTWRTQTCSPFRSVLKL